MSEASSEFLDRQVRVSAFEFRRICTARPSHGPGYSRATTFEGAVFPS